MEIVFRPASAADAPALASLIILAAQSHYRTTGYELSVGGNREHQHTEIARLAVTNARSWFHFSHFEVAQADDRVVASAAGFDKIAAEKEMPAALRELGWTDTAIQALDDRLAKLYAAFPDEPADCWTLDHIAVLPVFRKMGLAWSLMQRQFRRGLAAGFHQCKLDVFQGNDKAIALYDSLGFKVSATFGETALREILNRDPLLRMTKPL